MSKKQTPFLIGAALVLLALLLYYLGRGEDNYSWQEHYEPGSKDPYGTYLVRNLLEDYYPGQPFEVVTDSLGERLDSGNFVFVGNDFWIDSASLSQLLGFVAAGNRAFVACPYLPHDLLDSLGGFECAHYDEEADSSYMTTDTYQAAITNTAVSLNFQHPALSDTTGYTLKYLFLRSPTSHLWDFFPNEYLCDSQKVFATLGLLNGEQPNFVRASYGDGEFYLHTTPLAFTNLHLLEKRGLEYASKAFSHLRPGRIYWDERVFDPYDDMAGGGGNKQSPLRYILSQPALAWAWYVILGMALLYLIFRAKRRQRVIPVLEKNVNTSLEFIGTIGRLFFIQNNHRQLASQKMRLFLIFVRERYRMPTKDLNEQFAKNLAIRSNVPEDIIMKILYMSVNIDKSSTVNEEIMVDFHRLVERFYRECR